MSAGKTFVVRRGMTAVPNRTVYDDRLSYAALGVLTVLLARPDGAPAGYRDLMGRGLGQAAMLTALRELDAAGYRHLIRRAGPRGRFVTDVVVSEVPITPEAAQQHLSGRPLPGLDVPRTMRGKATPGATSANAASPQVAPRGASPQHGAPQPGEEPHVSTRPKVTTSLRSVSPGEPIAECPHGDPKGDRHCPLCRRGLLPGVAAWDAEPRRLEVVR